jgi:ribosomal protein S18 acetylase RimI-like enzyme
VTEPRIRPARAEDLDAALQLFADLDRHQREWRVFPPRRSLRHETAERYRRALDDPAFRHAVAVEGHHLVGMALGEIVAGSTFSDERALEISGVMVLEARRGQGIGRALVADLVAFGRERGVARVFVRVFARNESAVRFWASLGMEPRVVQLTGSIEAVEGRLGGDWRISAE